MLKGICLSKNNTLGIIAPASCEEDTKINEYINTFKSKTNINIIKGTHVYDKYGLFCGTPQNRAKDLEDMFKNPDINGIICLRGGFGSSMMIPYINKEIIINNPKFFCGYSDITSLLNYFCSMNLISFHGPMINSNWDDIETLNSFLDVITNSNENFTYNLRNYDGISYINGKSFSGKLIGGNLTTICSNIGTMYSINPPKNSILIIEDINEAPYVISRMIYQLKQNNFLKHCSGIIIGYLSDIDNYNNSSYKFHLEKVIIDLLSDLNIPLILGFPFGHNYPNLTLPLNCNCSFDYNNRKLIFTEKFLIEKD